MPLDTELDMWTQSYDDMNKLDRRWDELTDDQKLKVAEVKALLAVGQALDRIHYNGVGAEQRPRPTKS